MVLVFYHTRAKEVHPLHLFFDFFPKNITEMLSKSSIAFFAPLRYNRSITKRRFAMVVNGLQKLTLLDYPAHCACTVFLAGCNLRCPFCHNASLVLGQGDLALSEEDFFSFLCKRKGLLDGVCVTGGEPLLRPDLLPFLQKIKENGFAVKLDTNGTFPDRLKEVIDAGVLDYIAMDLKNSLPLYEKTCGKAVDTDAIVKSIDLIRKSGIAHEFRTTCVKGFHTPESILELTSLIAGEENYFLQNFVDSGALLDPSCKGLSREEMNALLFSAQKNVKSAATRGL
jgi:pyruvate formate lyase activating enzyme